MSINPKKQECVVPVMKGVICRDGKSRCYPSPSE